MASYQALYYPFIHFKDDGWVKLAALYWDRLGRIVPDGYATHDSDTVRALGDFVKPLRPGWVRPEFGETFVAFVAQHAPALRKRYALALRDEPATRADWPAVDAAARPPTAGGPSGADPRLSYVFYEKMTPDLYRALNESGLASTDQRGAPWIGMHPKLASVYMTALAEQLAGEQGLQPLTDETFDHMALSGFSIERLAHALLADVPLAGPGAGASEVESALLTVAFRAVVPDGVETLDVDKVLAFRDKYPAERARFQEAVAGLLKSREWLGKIHDRKVLEERLRDEVDKTWRLQLDELDGKLRDVGIKTAWSAFNVKATLPAALLGAAALLALPLQPLAAGTAAVALGVLPALHDQRKGAADALRASNVAYLYRLEQELAPRDLLGWVRESSKRFALGV